MNLLPLPKGLESYQTMIEKSIQPIIRIKTKLGSPPLYESKFGGHPYLPKGYPHPLDEKGSPMRLLAQYDCSQLPPLPDMPGRGMLQFFISVTDDLMGLNMDDPAEQKNFRILYHPDIIKDANQLVTDFTYASLDADDFFPVDKEYALSFEAEEEAISLADFRFDKLDIPYETMSADGDEIWEVWEEHISNSGHKIGGYGFFTQSDPREGSYDKHTVLLLQIDSENEDDDDGIMWGDAGVGNFFIRSEDLRRLDFSKVLYNWDCF